MNSRLLQKIVPVLLAVLLISFFSYNYYTLHINGFKYWRAQQIFALYLFIAIIFFGITFLCYKRGMLKSERSKTIFVSVFGLFVTLYMVEIILRISGKGTTYTEQREGFFVNPAERMQKSWYTVWPPRTTFEMKTPEYCYPRTTNSEGLSDVEWQLEKDSNEIRVIALGASITEGDGAPVDSTYPRLLQKILQQQFPEAKINVMNAGRAGSDPWFEYKKLHDRLLKYKPDIVLYTMSSKDLFNDHLTFGGMERFVSDSTVTNKLGNHSWLGLFEVSYLFRLGLTIVGYDNTLFSKSDRKKDEAVALADARKVSRLFSRLAADNDFDCVQIIKPGKGEMKRGKYHLNLNLGELTVDTAALPNFSSYDLFPYFKDSLHIDAGSLNGYYWNVDQHHNAAGYAAMARGIAAYLEPLVAKRIELKHNRTITGLRLLAVTTLVNE